MLKRREVQTMIGLGKTRLYQMVRAGEFPPPFQIGPRAVRWKESEVIAWLEARERGLRPENQPTSA